MAATSNRPPMVQIRHCSFSMGPLAQLKARGLSDSFQDAMFANSRRPDLVQSIHAEYVRCGCNVLTTNTFVLTPSELARAGVARGSYLHCSPLRVTVRAAASVSWPQQVLIAGCQAAAAPLLLARASWHRRRDAWGHEEIAKEQGRVSTYFAETLCSSAEASAVLQAVALLGKPYDLITTRRHHRPTKVTDGTIIADALARCASQRQLRPYNCCSPQVLAAGLRAPPGATTRWVRKWLPPPPVSGCTRVGRLLQGCDPVLHCFACPTCTADYDAQTGIITPLYTAHANLGRAGATIVGGCCGVGPSHLQAVRITAELECPFQSPFSLAFFVRYLFSLSNAGFRNP